MAKITAYQCDRCGAVVREVMTVLGKEVCASCADKVEAFISPPITGHAPRGKRAGDAMRLIEIYGSVSPKQLAERSGITRANAYEVLGGLVRKGAIRRSKPGVYVEAR